MCRRKKILFLPEFLADQSTVSYREWSRYDVRESLEALMDMLEPRQAALIVLIDVFGFTPSETAVVLGQPVTTVKAALHRARNRLKKAADRHFHLLGTDDLPAVEAVSKADGELLDAFVRAFRSADAYSMLCTYRELSASGIKVRQVRIVHGHTWFSFLDPDGNVLIVTSPLIQNSED
jgi:RNA polymerase sigma-70 factor (ECF subfamily)